MQRKFILNLGLLLLLNLLIKPFWIFGIDRTVQNTLSAEDYGTYFALFNFSMLFNILLDLGITNFNNRNIAQHNQLLSKYFSGIVVFKVLLAVLYFAITFVVGAAVGYDSIRFEMLLFLSVNQFLISFIQYLRSNIAGLHLFALDSLFSVLDKALMIVFCAVLLWGNFLSETFSIMHFVYGQTCAYLIAAMLIFVVVWTKVNHFKFKFNKPLIVLIVKQTAPFALLVLTMTFYYRLDTIMLDYMLIDGEIQSAVYAQAYRLMDGANQFGVLFAGLLLPIFAHMVKERNHLSSLVKLSFSILFIPAVVLAIVCWSSAQEIIEILYHEGGASVQVLPILMCCFVAISSTYIFGTLLTANNNLKQLNIMAVAGLLLNLILNFVLIPSYKAYGSAVASLITQVTIVLTQIIIAKRVFKFAINYKYIVVLTAIIASLLAANYFMAEVGLIVRFVVLSAQALILAFAFQIISLQNIKNLLLKRNASSFE